MTLAAILGICLILPWPRASVVSSPPAIAISQSIPSQDSKPSKTPDHSATAPPATVTQTCPDNSQAGSTLKSDCKPAQSAGTKTKKHHRKTIAPTKTPTAESGPIKTVVPNGGTADPTVDLSPGLTRQQASSQTESTNQLLATSDANLKKISGRQLSANQQDTVKQIKNYIEQAKTASKGGDVQRAHNLAVKANLLSAELAGH